MHCPLGLEKSELAAKIAALLHLLTHSMAATARIAGCCALCKPLQTQAKIHAAICRASGGFENVGRMEVLLPSSKQAAAAALCIRGYT